MLEPKVIRIIVDQCLYCVFWDIGGCQSPDAAGDTNPIDECGSQEIRPDADRICGILGE